MYYVITKNDILVGVILDNAYSLDLSSDYSIHELDGSLPDLNTHIWDPSIDDWAEDPHKLTKLQFLNRFTMQERIAIRSSIDPIVNDIMNLLDAAEYVNTADQNTVMSIGYLSSVGLVESNRVSEILG